MSSSGSYSVATTPSYGASTRITGDYTSGFEGYTSGQKSGSASTPPRLAYSEGYSSPHTEEMDLSLSGSTTAVPATSPAPQEMTSEYAMQKEQEIRDMLYARRTGASEEEIQKMAGTYQYRQTQKQLSQTSPSTGEETKNPSLSTAEAQSRAYAEDARLRAMEDGMKRDAYLKSISEQKGDISKEDIDYSKISRTAQSASDGQFIDRSKVKDQYWGDGNHQLTYEKRGDGTVLIREDGVAMGFTTEDALKQKAVDSISLAEQIEAEKAKIHEEIWSAPATQTSKVASSSVPVNPDMNGKDTIAKAVAEQEAKPTESKPSNYIDALENPKKKYQEEWNKYLEEHNIKPFTPLVEQERERLASMMGDKEFNLPKYTALDYAKQQLGIDKYGKKIETTQTNSYVGGGAPSSVPVSSDMNGHDVIKQAMAQQTTQPSSYVPGGAPSNVPVGGINQDMNGHDTIAQAIASQKTPATTSYVGGGAPSSVPVSSDMNGHDTIAQAIASQTTQPSSYTASHNTTEEYLKNNAPTDFFVKPKENTYLNKITTENSEGTAKFDGSQKFKGYFDR